MNRRTVMASALHDVQVLEVGNFMAGPFATMQLADLGADVLKIESPDTGDPMRQTGPFVNGHSSPFARLNRNKASVALDLKHARGREAFLRMVDNSDILVENLRPGAMHRLGLDYEALHRRNRRLVYASASGWGQDGPLANKPGLDIMAQARSGLMSITGNAEGTPVKIGVPICDLTAALYVTIAVLAALNHRHTSGEGQFIDVSLVETGVSLAVWEAGRFFATGEVPGRLGSAHQSTAPYQAVECTDGWVTLGAVTPRTWTNLCVALRVDQLLDDERFQSAATRHSHRQELIPEIESVTRVMTVHEVIDALDAVGVPCAPIESYAEVFGDDRLYGREYFWDAHHPVMGNVRQLGTPMRMSRTPARRDGAGPLLGADTRATLASVGYTDQEIEELLTEQAVGVTLPGGGGTIAT
jgi:formyl-CoA transferase